MTYSTINTFPGLVQEADQLLSPHHQGPRRVPVHVRHPPLPQAHRHRRGGADHSGEEGEADAGTTVLPTINKTRIIEYQGVY